MSRDTTVPEPGSFRDPSSRVYIANANSGAPKRVLRGLSATALENFGLLAAEPFYRKLVTDGVLVSAELLDNNDAAAKAVLADGWAGVLEHQLVPFISYPYEWSFAMLRDAALLQLRIAEDALENGWTVKDATPFNIQFIGSRPVFIDTPSFEPHVPGTPWVGYRQFCASFLTPLLLRRHLRLDHLPLMRSYIDGIPPSEAIKFFNGRNLLKRGVLSHIAFPAKVENSIAKRERDGAPAARRTGRAQSKAMVVGLVQSLAALIRSLKSQITHTDWSQYDRTHSYEEPDFAAKQHFVAKHVGSAAPGLVWDIGCNTGTFSRLSAAHGHKVVSIDGDHDAIEQLYLKLGQDREPSDQILPLVMNLANPSPSQGWAGKERMPFDGREKPDIILCLALIHHIRLSANVPNAHFLKWLHSLGARVVLEFVHRHDEMVVKLLTNKTEQYSDYCGEQFFDEVSEFFSIEDRQPLKGGKREILLLVPR